MKSIVHDNSKKIKFSELIEVSEYENRHLTMIRMKEHDGISIFHTNFQTLVILYINFMFNRFLLFLKTFGNNDLHKFNELLNEIIFKIQTKGISPILKGGGGKKIFLNTHCLPLLIELQNILNSSIRLRNCYISQLNL
jgi:hypothetical protein